VVIKKKMEGWQIALIVIAIVIILILLLILWFVWRRKGVPYVQLYGEQDVREEVEYLTNKIDLKKRQHQIEKNIPKYNEESEEIRLLEERRAELW
jgi:hypothetical protein